MIRLISINQILLIMQENKQLIVLTHLSQLITLVIGFGSLLLPLIIWLTQKDKVYNLDKHGKNIVNFQLSLLVYCLLCIPLILFLDKSGKEFNKFFLTTFFL